MTKLIAAALAVVGHFRLGLGAKEGLRGAWGEIEAKIKKNGVEKFSLDVVDVDKSAEGKVVGTCDGGSKKIVYKKGSRN